ncbi:MAG: NAD-dependent epimerase/dehydratase family protein [Akkermansiaceae bacterium]|nr:NAD-dependent epimerase/dehydratase family protein [Akkermansiaceae bacterium]
MKLLLIGHGYLGQAITREFLSGGWEVATVSRSGEDAALACDVGNAGDVAKLPQADFMVHCAASGRGGAEAYQQVYVDGCRNLTKNFPTTPLLFTSSSSVYAQTDGEIVTEESPAIPDRDTGKLLLEAEQIVLAAGGIVTRLSGIYGPERSVLLKKFFSGEAVIEEDGRRFLNQIHRDDAARAIFHLATLQPRPSREIFNLTDSVSLTQRECYQKLSEIFVRPLPPSGPRDLNRKRGWTHKQVSNEKLRATGWQPRFPSFLDAVGEIAKTL